MYATLLSLTFSFGSGVLFPAELGVAVPFTTPAHFFPFSFCAPFYDFLDQTAKRAVHSFKSETPLVDAM